MVLNYLGQDKSVAAWGVLNLTQDIKEHLAPSPQPLATLSFSLSGQGGPYSIEDGTHWPMFSQHCSLNIGLCSLKKLPFPRGTYAA